MPANRRIGFATSPTARPTPRGAGLNVTTTEPTRPWTWNGSVCARPQPHSQLPQPRYTSTTSSFARSIARRIVGPTSRPFARPRPTNPSPLPTTTVTANLNRRPESVIRWTMLTSRTSSWRPGRSLSTICGSRRGRPLSMAAAIVVISSAATRRPSSVFGTHGGGAAGPPGPNPPRDGPLTGPLTVWPPSAGRCRGASTCTLRGAEGGASEGGRRSDARRSGSPPRRAGPPRPSRAAP